VPGQVAGLVADVRDAQPQVLEQLTLDRQVPLLREAVLDVALDGGDRRVRRNSARAGEWRRQGQRGRTTRRGLESFRKQEGRVGEAHLPEADEDRQRVVIKPRAAADYRPAVGERAERETDARREIVLVRLERFARSGGDGIGAYQALLG